LPCPPRSDAGNRAARCDALEAGANSQPERTRRVPDDQETSEMTVARITEISSISKKSFEDAIVQGVARANKTLKNVKGAWVKDQEVTIDKGKISGYKVILKVTFILAT
jgi:flavin-binding protein dodecin